MPIIKKIFIVSLLLFVISLLLWGVYNLSFKNDQLAQQEEEKVPVPPNSASQPDNSAKISAISSDPVLSPTLSLDGSKIRYYLKDTGQVYETDFYGNNAKSLSDKNNPGLENALWSADKSKAILKIRDTANNYVFFHSDFSENIPIKKNVDEIIWQTNANRIFYKYYDSQSRIRSLNVSDPDGKNWKKLTDLPYRYVTIAQIPKTGLISFWNAGDAYNETLFESIPIVGGEITILFKGKFGADYLWNNSGNRVLVSHTDSKGGRKMQLAVMNNNGGEYKNLEIPTFTSKCVWSRDDKTIYYALPGGIPDNSILPNDYKNGQFNTTDTFWKINLETGEKSRIIEPSGMAERLDASQIFLNQDESLLFFVNRIDNKLYRMSL